MYNDILNLYNYTKRCMGEEEGAGPTMVVATL